MSNLNAYKNVFITGGTGTLGRAILQRADDEQWSSSFTVFSRDPMRHMAMPDYKNITVRYVMGDIRDYDHLSRSMVGHDLVIHAAAMKHIPQGESEVMYTIETNVIGSYNVALAAVQHKVERVIGISTDKACYPVNTYGATKFLMERIFAEFSRNGRTAFVCCRYGNVIGSTGSVVQVWQQQRERGEKITITDPKMTRFWLSEAQAVDLVIESSEAISFPSGTIAIPNAPAVDMFTFAKMVVGEDLAPDDIQVVGVRAGEKTHECLLTAEEMGKSLIWDDDLIRLDLTRAHAYEKSLVTSDYIAVKVMERPLNSQFEEGIREVRALIESTKREAQS